ncbi:3-oxoacyl-ACP reductase [Pseudactinotalea sp. Z1748]|uniref:3-oxoacyl-ACP reductase n=1 Tax=Pseudactinotalea sp. Z1748 TaxID=3413027 RepID=UPI003C7B97C6
MSDTYLNLVNSGLTKKVAKQFGLPRPARLRRTDPKSIDAPLVTGPVVVLGTGADADTLATTLLDWELDVRRTMRGGRVGALMLVLTELTAPEDAAEVVDQAGPLMKALGPSGRVVVLTRAATDQDSPARAAALAGVEGLWRTVAKEVRYGATANAVVLRDGVGVDAPAALGAVRFLLSARSAFVSGQGLEVGSDAGTLPADWTKPLAGKVAVVTGSARGIGAQIARVLHREGAQVVGVDVPAAGESLASVMNEVGGTAIQADITDEATPARLIERVRERYGRLDVLVHNAGITRDKLLANMTPDRWQSVVAVNLRAQVQLNEALLATPDLSPDGLRIISLASTSGIAGNRGQSNYAFTKAGVIGMTRSLAPLLAEHSGTANAVAPGFIETEMTARIPALQRQVARRLNSLQQGGQPVDVAEAVSFLASPQSAGINGQTLRVCGQHLMGA